MDIFCSLNLRDDCQKFIRILQISRNFVDYAKLVEMMRHANMELTNGKKSYRCFLRALNEQNFNGLKEIRQQTAAETYKYECY